jgi:hypothetical protein
MIRCFTFGGTFNMAQRKRAMQNTVAGAVEQFESIRRDIEPAFTLTEPQMAYFRRVITSREGNSWCSNHAAIATQLAVAMQQVDEANIALEAGIIVDGKTNPALAAKVALTNVIVSLNRVLGLSASQMGKSGQHQRQRNQNEVALRSSFANRSELDYELIPGLRELDEGRRNR